jgi:GTP cyclohydrolase I
VTQLSQSELLELKSLEARPPREAAPRTENPIARPSQEKSEAIYREMLDPNREGLLRTPHRAVEALKFLTNGYEQNVHTLLNGAIFHEDYEDMVVVKDIEFYSLCEHHMLPFYGRAHVAYIPNGKIIGLSKIPRLVDMFARRLQVQERLTIQIAEALEEALEPKGVAVVVEGIHMCMLMRGVQKQSASMVTSHVMGVFRSDRATRQEFMALVKDNARH